MFIDCLKKATIFENAAPSNVSSYVQRHVGMHVMHGGKTAERAMLRHASMGNLGLSMISYGDYVTVANPEGIDGYHFHMVIEGSCSIEISEQQLDLRAGCATVVSSGVPSSVSYSPNCTKIIVDIPRQLLHACAIDGAGSVPAAGIFFTPEPIDVGNDQVAFKLLELLMLEADRCSRTHRFWRPLQQTFASNLLDIFPTNLFTTTPELVDDNFLSRVDRFIEDHIREDINTARLAKEYGISERTLCNRFHQHAGVSPSRYLKNRRLHHMHMLLSQQVRGAVNVTDLAFDLGFNHLGRFAADYRAAFGELPSDTLRRHRQSLTH